MSYSIRVYKKYSSTDTSENKPESDVFFCREDSDFIRKSLDENEDLSDLNLNQIEISKRNNCPFCNAEYQHFTLKESLSKYESAAKNGNNSFDLLKQTSSIKSTISNNENKLNFYSKSRIEIDIRPDLENNFQFNFTDNHIDQLFHKSNSTSSIKNPKNVYIKNVFYFLNNFYRSENENNEDESLMMTKDNGPNRKIMSNIPDLNNLINKFNDTNNDR